MKNMILLFAALLASFSARAIDLEGNVGPYISQKGSGMDNGSAIMFGKFSKDQSCSGKVFIADTPITAGDVLIFSSSTAQVAVTKTTSAGSPSAVGIALTTAAAGARVQVCLGGGLVLASSAVNTTVGQIMVTSGTAGRLTPASSVTDTGFSFISGTALVFRAWQTKTISSTDYQVLGVVIGK